MPGWTDTWDQTEWLDSTRASCPASSHQFLLSTFRQKLLAYSKRIGKVSLPCACPTQPRFFTSSQREEEHAFNTWLSSPPPPYSTPGPLEPLSKTLTKCISKLMLGTFPGGPVAMTPSSQCRRPQVRSLVLQPRVHMTWQKIPPASTKTQYRQIHNKMKK